MTYGELRKLSAELEAQAESEGWDGAALDNVKALGNYLANNPEAKGAVDVDTVPLSVLERYELRV